MTDVYLQAKSIVSRLNHAGYLAYFAGGWVRDFLMGHPSEDIDIATSAPTDIIMDLFPQTILVGLAFGVVIVVMEGHQFEVATFRKDLNYLDGRHPQGIERSTPHEDALRRDFTINGMFYDPLEETIHDYVHGREDIQLGIIRTIGDPQERFFEDRLRMLRAFRFSARFGFRIASDTQEAIRENADKLFPAVAMERVWLEFKKMAAYPQFDQALVQMHSLTLLDVIFPEIHPIHIKDLRHLVRNYTHFPLNCPPILYLMEIMDSLSFEQKREVGKRLKINNRDLKLIDFMESLSQTVLEELDTGGVELYRWASLFAHPDWELCMQILALRYAEKAPSHYFQTLYARAKDLEAHIHRLKTGKPLVSAAFLQRQGIKPGKQMGILLKRAERLAINENLNDPEIVFTKLKWHE